MYVDTIMMMKFPQDRVMAENNDLKVEVESLRTEVALLSPDGTDTMDGTATVCRPVTW